MIRGCNQICTTRPGGFVVQPHGGCGLVGLGGRVTRHHRRVVGKTGLTQLAHSNKPARTWRAREILLARKWTIALVHIAIFCIFRVLNRKMSNVLILTNWKLKPMLVLANLIFQSLCTKAVMWMWWRLLQKITEAIMTNREMGFSLLQPNAFVPLP